MNKQSARTYTPVFDDLIPKFGTMGALVFGVIWRYCQMRDGTCHASYETLAVEIGVTEKTIRNHVAKLAANGHIELHDRKNGGPYWITVSAELGSTRSKSDRNEVPTSNTKQETNKRPLNATRSRKTPRKRKKRTRPFFDLEQQVLVDHFSEATGLQIPKLGGSAWGSVTKSWKIPLQGILETTGTVDGACELITRTGHEFIPTVTANNRGILYFLCAKWARFHTLAFRHPLEMASDSVQNQSSPKLGEIIVAP